MTLAVTVLSNLIDILSYTIICYRLFSQPFVRISYMLTPSCCARVSQGSNRRVGSQ